MLQKSRDFGHTIHRQQYFVNDVETSTWNIIRPLGSEQIEWISDVFVNHKRTSNSWKDGIMVRGTPTAPNHSAFWAYGSDCGFFIPDHEKRLYVPTWQDVANKIVNPFGNQLVPFLAEIGEIRSLTNLLRSRSWSDWHLGIQFGVLPVIQDVRKLIASIRNYNAFIDRMFNREGLNNSVRFKTESVGSYTVNIEKDGFLIGVKTNYLITNRYSCKARYTLPDSFPRFRLTLDYFNLLPDLSDLWELVPLSFLLDWIFDIGSVADSLSPNLISESLEISRGFVSQKVEGTAEWIIKEPLEPYWSSSEAGYAFGEQKFKTYTRFRQLPFIISNDLWGDQLSLNQFATIASLSHQRISL